MPTGDAYSSGHLVPSLWDLHMFYLLWPIFFRTCRYLIGLCSSNIPRYFLDFALNIRQSKQSSVRLEARSGLRTTRFPTNKQRGRGSRPCVVSGSLDESRHIVPTDWLVRVQCFRKGLSKAVEGPSTGPIFLSMITELYLPRRRRLTTSEPDETKFASHLTHLRL